MSLPGHMPATRVSARRLRPRKLPKQRRSEATVEAILQAAAQVFERHGYAAGTTNRIAERAGVSIGSLYQYFPNKDAILVALVRCHLAEGASALGPHIARLRSGAPVETTIAGVVEAMRLHAAAPRLHRVLFEETPLPTSLRAEVEAGESVLVEELATALARRPGGGGRNPRLTAAVVVSAVEGLTHRLGLRPPQGVDPEAVAGEIIALLEAYLERLS